MAACSGILASSVSTLLNWSSVNTRIGWPNVYWNAGMLPFFGYLVVWLFVAISVLMMIDMLSYKSPDHPVSGALALLIAAATLLQFLPGSEKGVQFLPHLPWTYPGLVSFLFSVLAWLAIGLAGLFACALDSGKAQPVSSLLLFALGLNSVLSFWAPEAAQNSVHRSPPAPVKQVTPAAKQEEVGPGGQIANWQHKRVGAQRVLETLLSERRRLAERLLELGVRSANDLAENKPAQPLIEELRELVGQIADVRQDIAHLDRSIVEAESNLRRLERRKLIQAQGLLAEQEVGQITRTTLELGAKVDNRLLRTTPIPDSEIDAALQEALRQ